LCCDRKPKIASVLWSGRSSPGERSSLVCERRLAMNLRMFTRESRSSGHPRSGLTASARRRPRRVAPSELEGLEGRVGLSTWTVTSAASAGAGSLRAEIGAAQFGDTIRFADSLKGQTIHLSGGELMIDKSLSIQGPGADVLDVDAGGRSRVFKITPSAA